tara:strand:+ start:1387 stop:1953 length:567 start_codon:yes stop_codon:yes gene_type:complete
MRFVFSPLHNTTKKQSGFSLIELLITISIVIMVVGAVLVKNTGFNSTVLLKTQAQEVALDIRTAQQYGVSARADRTDTGAAYGIYFSAATPELYQLYLDDDGDQVYDTGEAVGAAFVLDDRFIINDICVAGTCGSSEVSIAFQRPDFDAAIYYAGGRATLVEIVVVSRTDTTAQRTVAVYETGQIAVE